MEQWRRRVSRLIWDQETAGSNPACSTSGIAAEQGREVLRKKMILLVKGFLQDYLPEHLACEDVRFNPTGRNPKILHSILMPWYTAGFQ